MVPWHSKRKQNTEFSFFSFQFSFLLVFYYKDISDELTVIFRVIQCVIVEEKTVITFIWNLCPCTVLHWIASSSKMMRIAFQPMSFLTFPLLILLPTPPGKKWVSGCVVLSCQVGLMYDNYFILFFILKSLMVLFFGQ